MSERKPAEVFDPRDFLDEEMAAREMAVEDMPAEVQRWMDSDEPMPSMAAYQLGMIFDMSMAYWLNLDEAWRSR